MKYTLYLILMLLISQRLVAQDASVVASTSETSLISNNLNIPASPNAHELGEYGSVPVNLSSGSLGLTIPVLTASEGGITIPISLAYQSSGLKVDASPSWVGMDWVLSNT